MTRLISGLVVFASIGCFSANAVTFLSSLQVMPTVKSTRAATDTCANFSGSWKGTCTSAQGQSTAEAFTITQQGCEMMAVDSASHGKMTLAIGGVFSAGGSIPGTPATTFGGNFMTNWDAAEKVLSVYAMGGMKKLDITDAGTGGALMEKISLVSDTKLADDIYEMGGKGNKIAFCSFDKQP